MTFSLKHKERLPYLLAPNLSGHKDMLHAFTTRLGGVSKQEFDSLNLALHVGDLDQDVIKNRSLVADLFGCDLSDTVAVKQIHGIHIKKITARDKGQGALEYTEDLPEADAMITNEPGILLWCFFADCVPVLFFDPVERVIASTHAGWRGTYRHIAAETIKAMKETYASKEENIQVAIGPSAGGCCYEVGSEVVELFHQEGFKDVAKPYGEKYTLDLWKANKQSLLNVGIPDKNISIAGLCTSCLTDLFFSYRAEQGKTGRIAAAIMLKA